MGVERGRARAVRAQVQFGGCPPRPAPAPCQPHLPHLRPPALAVPRPVRVRSLAMAVAVGWGPGASARGCTSGAACVFCAAVPPERRRSRSRSLSLSLLTLPTRSPRGRNLMATCRPVRLLRANWTKPNAPALRWRTRSYFSLPARGSIFGARAAARGASELGVANTFPFSFFLHELTCPARTTRRPAHRRPCPPPNPVAPATCASGRWRMTRRRAAAAARAVGVAAAALTRPMRRRPPPTRPPPP